MNTVTAPVAATLAKIHALPAVGAAWLENLAQWANAPVHALNAVSTHKKMAAWVFAATLGAAMPAQ